MNIQRQDVDIHEFYCRLGGNVAKIPDGNQGASAARLHRDGRLHWWFPGTGDGEEAAWDRTLAQDCCAAAIMHRCSAESDATGENHALSQAHCDALSAACVLGTAEPVGQGRHGQRRRFSPRRSASSGQGRRWQTHLPDVARTGSVNGGGEAVRAARHGSFKIDKTPLVPHIEDVGGSAHVIRD